MELPICKFIPILSITLIFLISPIQCQINTPCTPQLLSSFTPCMNFLTNSSSNGTNPTSDCCGSLRSLTSNGIDCLCLLVTGSVPVQVPINRTLAVSLPKACNMPGVPLQCKASVAPVPAPSPGSLGPAASPRVSPSASPTSPRVSPSASPTGPVVPEPTASTPPPESSTTPALTPPLSSSTPVLTPPSSSGIPASGSGIQPTITPPSSSATSHTISAAVVLFALGLLLVKLY